MLVFITIRKFSYKTVRTPYYDMKLVYTSEIWCLVSYTCSSFYLYKAREDH